MIVLVYVAILINQFIPITSHNSESDGLLGSGAGRPRKKVSRQYTNEYLRRLTPNESYFSIKLGKYIPGGYNTTEDGAEVEVSTCIYLNTIWYILQCLYREVGENVCDTQMLLMMAPCNLMCISTEVTVQGNGQAEQEREELLCQNLHLTLQSLQMD